MKRVKSVVLILLILSVILPGCQISEPDRSGKEVKITLLADTSGDEFIRRIETIMRKASDGYVKFISEDSQGNFAVQQEKIENLSEKGVNSLVINIVERSEGFSVLEMAKQKNMPVVFVHREPDESVISGWNMAYYVGSKPTEAGRMSIEILLDYFNEHPDADGNRDGIIQYVALTGEIDHQDTVYRMQGYKEAFRENILNNGVGGHELERISAGWDRETAKDKTKKLINNFPYQIEAVLANNDEMALGAIDALREVGYFGEGRKFMPVIGIGGSREALESISQGIMLGTVLSDAVSQGVDSLYIAAALAKGEKPLDTSVRMTSVGGTGTGRYIWVPHHKVTQKNYRKYTGK